MKIAMRLRETVMKQCAHRRWERWMCYWFCRQVDVLKVVSLSSFSRKKHVFKRECWNLYFVLIKNIVSYDVIGLSEYAEPLLHHKVTNLLRGPFYDAADYYIASSVTIIDIWDYWNGFRRKRSWPDRGVNPTVSWREGGNSWKTQDFRCLADIRVEYIPNTTRALPVRETAR
jgi:hypothetical protein